MKHPPIPAPDLRRVEEALARVLGFTLAGRMAT